MKINDPFKTREDAIKTLLSVDIMPVQHLCDLNRGITPTGVYEYFNSLYKKWPDDFTLDSSGEDIILKFMGREVISFVENDRITKGPREFFGYWGSLLLDRFKSLSGKS